MLREHLAGERVDLGLPDALQAGAFETEVNSSDS